MNRRVAQALIIIFVIFMMLFHAPVIEVINRNALVLGVPVMLVYFGLLWLALIFLTWFVIDKFKDQDHGN